MPPKSSRGGRTKASASEEAIKGAIDFSTPKLFELPQIAQVFASTSASITLDYASILESFVADVQKSREEAERILSEHSLNYGFETDGLEKTRHELDVYKSWANGVLNKKKQLKSKKTAKKEEVEIAEPILVQDEPVPEKKGKVEREEKIPLQNKHVPLQEELEKNTEPVSRNVIVKEEVEDDYDDDVANTSARFDQMHINDISPQKTPRHVVALRTPTKCMTPLATRTPRALTPSRVPRCANIVKESKHEEDLKKKQVLAQKNRELLLKQKVDANRAKEQLRQEKVKANRELQERLKQEKIEAKRKVEISQKMFESIPVATSLVASPARVVHMSPARVHITRNKTPIAAIRKVESTPGRVPAKTMRVNVLKQDATRAATANSPSRQIEPKRKCAKNVTVKTEEEQEAESCRKAEERRLRKAAEEAEKQRLIREQEEYLRQMDEQRKEEERRREQEQERLAMEQQKRKELEEQKRLAEEEEKRRAAEEAECRRIAELAAQKEAEMQELAAQREIELKKALSLEKKSMAEKRTDSYEMTPPRIYVAKSEEDYGLDDLNSDDETDDEEDPRKRIPKWADIAEVRRVVRTQRRDPPFDVDNFFGPIPTPNLRMIFGDVKVKKRGSSAVWSSPLAAPSKGKATTPMWLRK